VKWKTFNHFVASLFGKTIYQISLESREFYRRYYEEQFGLIFFPDTV